MRKTGELSQRLLTGIFAVMLAFGIFGGGFFLSGTVSHAETQVKITSPKGVNVRKEASTSSEAVGGAENGKVLSVLSQTQGADGYTWYQVQLNSTTTGYVRADLVEVSEGGSTPSTGNEGGEEGGGTTAPAEVMAVNPVSATVSGESGIIRDSASSEGQILAEATTDTVLTVTGQVTAADGRVWYEVNFISGETQVDGFIRSDFVTLSGELTPYEEPSAPEEPSEPTTPEPEEDNSPYELREQNGQWLLIDKVNDPTHGNPVDQLLTNAKNGVELLEKSEKTAKSQKIIIIILVFLLVAAAAGIAFLVFKIRDMMDSAYYNEVENETLRKRNAAAGRGEQKTMHAAGTDRQSARPSGARPGAGQRSAGTSQAQRGTGPVQRTAGTTHGQRPTGTSQSQRMAGTTQGQRPTGTSQSQRGAGIPQGQRVGQPVQGQRAVDPGQNQRPVGSGQRTRGAVQGQRPATVSQREAGNPNSQQPSQRVQPKNFLEEDDEFEFEFLNYDGEEE